MSAIAGQTATPNGLTFFLNQFLKPHVFHLYPIIARVYHLYLDKPGV